MGRHIKRIAKAICRRFRPKDTTVKYDNGKTRYDLIPPYALEQLALVYTHGAQKYPSARNWEKGTWWGRYFGAAMRHLWAFWRGEEIDKDSGLPHLSHAAWCCFTLLEYAKNHKEFDDRKRDRV